MFFFHLISIDNIIPNVSSLVNSPADRAKVRSPLPLSSKREVRMIATVDCQPKINVVALALFPFIGGDVMAG